MGSELLPCPFCGGPALYHPVGDADAPDATTVFCDNADCAADPVVEQSTRALAIAAWNRRAASDRLREAEGLLRRAHEQHFAQSPQCTCKLHGEIRAFLAAPARGGVADPGALIREAMRALPAEEDPVGPIHTGVRQPLDAALRGWLRWGPAPAPPSAAARCEEKNGNNVCEREKGHGGPHKDRSWEWGQRPDGSCFIDVPVRVRAAREEPARCEMCGGSGCEPSATDGPPAAPPCRDCAGTGLANGCGDPTCNSAPVRAHVHGGPVATGRAGGGA